MNSRVKRLALAGVAIIGLLTAESSFPGVTSVVVSAITAALPAGANLIGNVGGKTTKVCTSPTVAAANAYGVNYVVGGKLTFANLFTATGTGVLQNVEVTIKDTETNGFTFFPFSADTTTTWTDAAVAAIAAGDVSKVKGAVSLTSNIQLAASGFSVQYAYGLGMAWTPGTTSGFGVLLANAPLTTNFAAASDVTVCVTVLNDA